MRFLAGYPLLLLLALLPSQLVHAGPKVQDLLYRLCEKPTPVDAQRTTNALKIATRARGFEYTGVDGEKVTEWVEVALGYSSKPWVQLIVLDILLAHPRSVPRVRQAVHMLTLNSANERVRAAALEWFRIADVSFEDCFRRWVQSRDSEDGNGEAYWKPIQASLYNLSLNELDRIQENRRYLTVSERRELITELLLRSRKPGAGAFFVRVLRIGLPEDSAFILQSLKELVSGEPFIGDLPPEQYEQEIREAIDYAILHSRGKDSDWTLSLREVLRTVPDPSCRERLVPGIGIMVQAPSQTAAM